MKVHFIISDEKVEVIKWGDIVLPDGEKLILIASPKSIASLVEKGNDRYFLHIEPIDFEKVVDKTPSHLSRFEGSCFEVLKRTLQNLKLKFLAESESFSIVSNNEDSMWDCARLREFFNIPGDKIEDIERFTNKWIMKERLINKGIKPFYLPKCYIFDKDEFRQNPSKYLSKVIDTLGLPLFIKPLSGTASHGIYKADNIEALYAWCLSHQHDVAEYEIDEYLEGDVYHCASIIRNSKILFSVVSKYLNSYGEAVLNQKLLGSIILDQSEELALKIQSFNRAVIEAMLPVRDCVTHHEVFVKPNGEIVFLEIANRVIEGGSVAEMFDHQFGLNFREIDYKLRLGLQTQTLPKLPVTRYYAVIACLVNHKVIIEEIYEPSIDSEYQFLKKPQPGDYGSPNDCVLEMLLWNSDYQQLKNDFSTLKDFTLCRYTPLLLS